MSYVEQRLLSLSFAPDHVGFSSVSKGINYESRIKGELNALAYVD